MTEQRGASARRSVERFDRWAETYDRSRLQRLVFEPVHAALLDTLGPLEGRRILDVGTGTGTLAFELAARGARAAGVDPAPRMVAQAEKKSAADASDRQPTFLVASAESLPFEDASFDGATVSLTLHHWQDARRGVRELGRVLRPGARLAIADIDLPGPIRGSLRALRRPHAGWSRQELADMLYGSGFARVRAMSRGPLGPRLAIIAADR